MNNRWSVRDFLKKHTISERQFERTFYDSIGVSPKMYLRILRFRKALMLLHSDSSTRLFNVAYTLNYSDHSHFSREFKEFSGFTPKAYLTKYELGEERISFHMDKMESET